MSHSGGYVVQDKIRLLKLDDGEFAGVEARFGSLKTGEMADMIGLASIVESETATPEEAIAAGKAFTELIELLGKSLRSWNLLREDGVTKIPATIEGLNELDVDLTMELVALRMSAGSVSAPLEPTSNDGAPSVAPPIPMVDVSASPQTWSEPT